MAGSTGVTMTIGDANCVSLLKNVKLRGIGDIPVWYIKLIRQIMLKPDHFVFIIFCTVSVDDSAVHIFTVRAPFQMIHAEAGCITFECKQLLLLTCDIPLTHVGPVGLGYLF